VELRSVAAALVAALSVAVPAAACGDDGGGGAKPPSEEDMSPAAREGAALARDLGCVACHAVGEGRATGPSWVGLAGSEVELEGGRTVVADRDYLERAIRDPRSEVVAGYANIMPTTYELTDDQVDKLLAFIEELGGEPEG
jgi:cytochrome c1